MQLQSQTVVENVREFFVKEKICRAIINRMAVVKKTAEATGLLEKATWIINKEFIACESQLLTPVKRYMVSHIRVDPDAFDREAIQRLVHGFYTRREYPTLDGVLQKAREECGFPGGRFCLWRLLRQLVFTCDNIYEQTNILEQRHTYLKTIHRV